MRSIQTEAKAGIFEFEQRRTHQSRGTIFSSDKHFATMNILHATRSYERWLRKCTPVVEADLAAKHRQMKQDLIMFFRGTYYRWAQLWPSICTDLLDAPKVLAVGDLHVDSFGTWRDAEGRMAWGVDDFDESFPLPYTNDLVRLATSVKMLIDQSNLTLAFKQACNIVLQGYEATLRAQGRPIVLAEHQTILETLGIEAIRPPKDFWSKLNRRPGVGNSLPRDARIALEKWLPDKNLDYKVVFRKAGLGSLGQQRFVAIAEWKGGCIAREAKAMVPAASVWLGNDSDTTSYYEQIITSAVRAPDPFQTITGKWLIRRLSPDSNPIEIAGLPKVRDERTLLYAMGTETANVHLGSERQVKNILKDLTKRKAGWLRAASKRMAHAVEKEWKTYRES